MNDIPGLNMLPPKVQHWAILIAVLSPYLTRAFKALASGGGIRGVLSAIWLGTNTDTKSVAKLVDTKIAESQTQFIARNPDAK